MASGSNQGDLRDELAIERTSLANERTLLAYIRTGLALAAAGAVLLRFFHSQATTLIVAWLLLAAGAATAGIGSYRFAAVRRRLATSRGS